MHLPANLAISAHSRKFYDGTYTMISDGFTDEAGGKCGQRTKSSAGLMINSVSRFRLP
jgi:hypothetical protein